MTDLRKAAEMALKALEGNCTNPVADPEQAQEEDRAIQALRQALEQPEQEPVATVVKRQYEDGTYAGNALDWAGRNSEDDFPVGTKLYTAPPKREWASLTGYQRLKFADRFHISGEAIEAIEAKLKEKNT